MKVKIEDDQANELRSLFGEIIKEEQWKEELPPKEVGNEKREIDVLLLPPRKEVHTSGGRTHLKMGRPFIRFILVVILLSAIIIGAYYYWGDKLLHLIN